jgi:serine/threonine protein kinase
VARGIDFLHVFADPPLIHQDVKSDNILLTTVGGRLVAKVADFGTARYAPALLEMNTQGQRNTHHSTQTVTGTRPYMPIEYSTLGHVSEKTDAFAFGVVLCELLTAQPPADYAQGMLLAFTMTKSLADVERLLPPLLDARLGGDDAWQLPRALALGRVARHCLEFMPADRCTVSEQVQVLDELAGREFEACVRTGEKASNTAGYQLHRPNISDGSTGVNQPPKNNPLLVENSRGVRLTVEYAVE